MRRRPSLIWFLVVVLFCGVFIFISTETKLTVLNVEENQKYQIQPLLKDVADYQVTPPTTSSPYVPTATGKYALCFD
jgi:hypothetical protein